MEVFSRGRRACVTDSERRLRARRGRALAREGRRVAFGLVHRSRLLDAETRSRRVISDRREAPRRPARLDARRALQIGAGRALRRAPWTRTIRPTILDLIVRVARPPPGQNFPRHRGRISSRPRSEIRHRARHDSPRLSARNSSRPRSGICHLARHDLPRRQRTHFDPLRSAVRHLASLESPAPLRSSRLSSFRPSFFSRTDGRASRWPVSFRPPCLVAITQAALRRRATAPTRPPSSPNLSARDPPPVAHPDTI